MRALVLSDLHLEFRSFDLVHNGRRVDDGADAVILAGDIEDSHDAIIWARKTFENKEVVYVAGNHEFYHHHYEDHLGTLRSVAEWQGVHFLERDMVTIQGITFLGTTLWTDFKLFGDDEDSVDLARAIAQREMNDFRTISTNLPLVDDQEPSDRSRMFTPQDTINLHNESVAWLREELASADPAKTIVVTHHGPHLNSVHPKYRDNLLTPAFASNLEHLMGRSRYWIHGHMHDGQRYVVNDTEVVLNPRGYPMHRGGFENEIFDPALQIEI